MADESSEQKFSFWQQISNLGPDLRNYIQFRFRQIYIWTNLIIEFAVIVATNIKKEIVKRMFWGRNSFYRKSFHVAIIALTLLTLVNGISERIVNSGATSQQGLNVAEGIIGQNDMILQYVNPKVFAIENADELPFEVIEHEVKDGETIQTIAKKYNRDDVSSIIWANKMNAYNPKVTPGQILKIPPMKGVLVEAEQGDTASTIIKRTKINNANEIDVIDLNGLQDVDEPIIEGTLIFIPNGSIPLPAPSSSRTRVSGQSPSFINLADNGIDVPPGTFVNPVGDDSCTGYKRSRGWATYHTGVDLAKKGGCWISSVGEGVVEKVRWGGSLGFYVVILHENGIRSLYAHGNGEMAVKEGQAVKPGQKIMYMGATGRAYGVHLHFSMAVNDNDVISQRNRVNPAGVVPGI